MTKLADLGFQKGVIVETVVSTYNVDGTPNSAPMGVAMENPQQVKIRLFTSSSTLKNFKTKKCATINLTSDIEIFYKTTFKEANQKGKVPTEWFEKAKTVDAPKLCKAEAVVEVSVADIKPLGPEKSEVICDVKLISAAKALPKAYCRAFSLTLEAIIHATRVKNFISGNSERQKQAAKLLETIMDCREIVNRVAPQSQYSEIMADLDKRINVWRNKT